MSFNPEKETANFIRSAIRNRAPALLAGASLFAGAALSEAAQARYDLKD